MYFKLPLTLSATYRQQTAVVAHKQKRWINNFSVLLEGMSFFGEGWGSEEDSAM